MYPTNLVSKEQVKQSEHEAVAYKMAEEILTYTPEEQNEIIRNIRNSITETRERLIKETEFYIKQHEEKLQFLKETFQYL